jgi:hypothetical protein
MSEEPDTGARLPRSWVVALVVIAVVTAFFVGRAVTQPAPVPVATDEALESLNDVAASTAYPQPAPAQAGPVSEPRPAGNSTAAPASVVGAAYGEADAFAPSAALEPDSTEASGPASSGEPDVIAVDAPPPPVAVE